MEYYCSPDQTTTLTVDDMSKVNSIPPFPTGEQKPRRRKRGGVVLAIFLIIIALLIAAAVVLRILFPNTWTLDDFLQRIDDFEFSYELPDSFDFIFEFPDEFEPSPTSPMLPSDILAPSATLTTIPRAELDPSVQMQLLPTPEHALTFQEIYEKVLPSIVSIQAYTDYGSTSLGTGVILTEDGYIVTNHHIIAGCSVANVVLSDETLYEAELVGSDVESDLAVLKITAADLIAAEFGNSDQLQVGDTALAIGNPLGAELFGTLTEGIVSAINRNVNVDGYTMSLIQTTAALNPGNSGGALINTYGQIIGITNMKMMSSYETIEGLGFAIPTVWAKDVVDTLLSKGAITGRPTIGFTCYSITAEAAGRDGVYIETVTPGGPAALAGVRAGDIITEANGQPIATLEDLTVIRDEVGVGGTLELTIWRSGETITLSVVLVEQHELN